MGGDGFLVEQLGRSWGLGVRRALGVFGALSDAMVLEDAVVIVGVVCFFEPLNLCVCVAVVVIVFVVVDVFAVVVVGSLLWSLPRRDHVFVFDDTLLSEQGFVYITFVAARTHVGANA